jgi:hypothetical protein
LGDEIGLKQRFVGGQESGVVRVDLTANTDLDKADGAR